MAKWEVTFRVAKDARIVVEAETLEEAVQKADKAPPSEFHIDDERTWEGPTFALNLDTSAEYTLEDGEPVSSVSRAVDQVVMVTCQFCSKQVPGNTAHLYQDSWVGDECCWDERLRSSE